MLRLNRNQRELLAEKGCDLANLAAGALVFGQLLAERFSFWLAAGGLIMWVGFVALAFALINQRERR